jgi:hypothetical protein
MQSPIDVTSEAAAGPPLRLAVLVDRLSLTVWQREVLEQLRTAGDTELVLVVVNDATPETSSQQRTRPIDKRLFWRLYNNRWVARQSSAVRDTDSAGLFDNAQTLHTTPVRRGHFSQYLRQETLDHLEAADIDVILRFGFGILRGKVLELPRFGVWSFHHDDERVIRGGPPAFWEVADGLATTGVLLQRLTERLDGGIPLARATFRTNLRSYPSNRDRAALGAAGLPAVCARAARLGSLDVSGTPTDSAAPIRHDPSNREMLRFLCRQAARAVSGQIKSIVHGQRWQVGTIESTADPLALFEHDVGTSIRWIDDKIENGYLADPFPQRRDGRAATMVEQFDERTARGVISAVEHRDDGDHMHVGVIDPGVHTSYPFLLEQEGELYCIPETWQLGRVEAWRSIEFPTRWERHCVVLDDVPLLDPTIFRWENRWWLFGTRKDQGPDDALHAWHSSEPFGPWTAHLLNPIKIDVTSSRPAGTPFTHDGALYRPAQDCSTGYGAAVMLNRVVRLDPTQFVEEPVQRLDAGTIGGDDDAKSTLDGLHTISRGGGLVAIDARRPVIDRYRTWREFSSRIRRRLPLRKRST